MHATFLRPALAALTLSALLFTGVPAFAEMVSYKADLKASTEVPPTIARAPESLKRPMTLHLRSFLGRSPIRA